MIQFTIDNRSVEVSEGETILDGARKLGIEIPTLCHLDGVHRFTSCQVCLVEDAKSGRLMPSCSIKAENGMELINSSDTVRKARKTALDLLLSEHTGDCEAPCTRICPAHMEIPTMIRLIGEGRDLEALKKVKETIALPAILGRICPAPCEKGCRRKKVDEPVAICKLKGFVAEEDLASSSPYLPVKQASTGKRVALIGGGAAALSAAYYLQILGHSCTIYEKEDSLGGHIHDALMERGYSFDLLQKEAELVVQLGAEVKLGVEVGKDISFTQMKDDYDAVIIAVGTYESKDDFFKKFGVDTESKGIKANKKSFATNVEKVFAIGGAVTPGKLAIRSVAHGLFVASSVTAFLMEREPYKEHDVQVVINKISPQDLEQFLQNSSSEKQVKATGVEQTLTKEEALEEAKRCLRCDCGKPETCKLRLYSEEYGASTKAFSIGEERSFQRMFQSGNVIFESGKCIKCGLCVRITEDADEKLGMAFVGRGYNTEVEVPFGKALDEGLGKAAKKAVISCPTGALYFGEAYNDVTESEEGA